MNDTLTGKTIGKYKILNKIGSGGMADVYKGYQDNLDRYVAIKFMHAFLANDQDFLHRFKREAKAMASMRHPNIVRVFDFDTYGDNTYYLVMEYIGGGTLKDHLAADNQAGKNISLEKAKQIATEVADALAYAHARKMIHRDIKPANIMIDEETGKAVLTDFGIVKLVGGQGSSTVTVTGALIGTPAYMSPEQAMGEKGDHRVDIYSLGVVLFHMVTGHLPFDADTPLAVVMKQVNDPVPLPITFNPDVPLDLQDVILKALAKDPNDRFQTAVEMAAALRSVNLNKQHGAAVPPPAKPPTAVSDTPQPQAAPPTEILPPNEAAAALPVPPTTKRPAWLWAAAGILLLLIIGGGLFFSGILGNEATATSTTLAAVSNEETNTPQPTTVPTEMTAKGSATPNVLATQVAELSADATRRAQPTDTPQPTKTPKPTATANPTPDATAQFLLTCDFNAELTSTKVQNRPSNAVTTGADFTAEWGLKNTGTCPWPAGSQWQYVDGEKFGMEGETAVLTTEPVNSNEQIILTADFSAPTVAGTYKSTWQLQGPDGELIGDPLSFEFRVFPPATATPAVTNTPVPSPTPEQPDVVEGQADWIYTVDSCEYLGGDWRCQVTIIPYIDGSDAVGQFTVFVFDQPAGQATTFRGTGPFIYFAMARRCAAYNQTVRVVDDVTATEISEPLYIDPDNYFPGGCTE